MASIEAPETPSAPEIKAVCWDIHHNGTPKMREGVFPEYVYVVLRPVPLGGPQGCQILVNVINGKYGLPGGPMPDSLKVGPPGAAVIAAAETILLKTTGRHGTPMRNTHVYSDGKDVYLFADISCEVLGGSGPDAESPASDGNPLMWGFVHPGDLTTAAESPGVVPTIVAVVVPSGFAVMKIPLSESSRDSAKVSLELSARFM